MKSLTRNTKETEINAKLEIYGSGNAEISTGIGFFDHMLEAFTKHSWMDLKLDCKGDLEVDSHHSVEDCGIVIGSLLAQSIYPAQNIERFGFGSVVMDEACVECSLDISNRAFLSYSAPFGEIIEGKIIAPKVGDFECELIEEFFRALVFNAQITAHVTFKRGKNAHHIAEAIFKSFALALRHALTKNPRAKIPSTKGVL